MNALRSLLILLLQGFYTPQRKSKEIIALRFKLRSFLVAERFAEWKLEENNATMIYFAS